MKVPIYSNSISGEPGRLWGATEEESISPANEEEVPRVWYHHLNKPTAYRWWEKAAIFKVVCVFVLSMVVLECQLDSLLREEA